MSQFAHADNLATLDTFINCDVKKIATGCKKTLTRGMVLSNPQSVAEQWQGISVSNHRHVRL